MSSSDAHEPAREGDEAPGLPGFRTWRRVYWYVFGFFVTVVVLLAVFTWTFTG